MPENDEFISGLLNEQAIASMKDGRTSPSFPALNEGLEAKFFATAHEFFRSWLNDKQGATNNSAPCAIVMSRAIAQDIKRLEAKTIWYFASSFDVPIEGKILVANYDLSIVAEVPCDICTNPQSLGDALVELKLADSVHCMMRGDRREMHLCQAGLKGGSTSLVLSASSEVKLDPATIDAELWRFHCTFTQTSAGVLRPWKSAGNRITIDEAELKISSMLGYFLGTVVGPDNVNVEDQTPHGRIDIKIAKHGMKDEHGPCALECKVLRSREASGTETKSVSARRMIDHATEGVQQAYEYRKDINGTIAYLCCFDARSEDEDQSEVLAFAAIQNIFVRRYFMYSSPAEHRRAAIAARKAGKLLSGEVA